MKLQKGYDKEIAKSMIRDTIIEYRVPYMIMLGIVAGLELLMTIRGLLVFDFTKSVLKIYMGSYLVLFVASVITLYFLSKDGKDGKCSDRLEKAVDIYGSIIILWSAVISYVDIIRGNTILVFLTIIVFVACILVMDPKLYVAMVIIISAVLMYLSFTQGNEIIARFGYLINVFVFILFCILLSTVQFRLRIKAYKARKDLEAMSYHDQLTGMLNRHSLMTYLKNAKDKKAFHLGIIDADNFKYINDTYGHDMGDECLIDIAEYLDMEFGNRVFRYGGDEFILLTELDEECTSYNFNQVNKRLAKKYADMKVSISGGFYYVSDTEEDFKDIFRKADNALYQAKNKGKGRSAFYHND